MPDVDASKDYGVGGADSTESSENPKTLQRRNREGSRYLYHEGKGSRVAASMGVREENKPRANRRITHMGENKPLLVEN